MALHQKYQERGLVVRAVTSAEASEAQRIVDEHDLPFEVIADGQAILDDYGIDFIWGSVFLLMDAKRLVLAEGLEPAQEYLAKKLGD